jgi:hypothetical protein
MTEEEAKAAEQAAAAEKAEQATTEPQQGDNGKPTDTVSKADYDKLLADLQNFKRIEDERKAKEKQRQEGLLKEQGKFKDLYDAATKESESLKERVTKFDTMIKGMLEEEMKGLPEEFDKTLIPDGDALDQLNWIRKAKPVLVAKPEARRGDGTPPASQNPGLSGMRSIYTHPTSPKH